MFRRDDLVQFVYDAAVDAGVRILFNSTVVAIDEETPRVTLSDGTEISADLIVGADGTYCQYISIGKDLTASRREVNDPTPPLLRSRHHTHHHRPSMFPLQCPLRNHGAR